LRQTYISPVYYAARSNVIDTIATCFAGRLPNAGSQSTTGTLQPKYMFKGRFWQNLVLCLINQTVCTNPWHHAAQLFTNLFD
jgi:hypothetical protein